LFQATGRIPSVDYIGPRAEAGERIFSQKLSALRAGGFAFLNAESKDEAIELCKAFLKVAGPGTCELRQILEFAPQPA
jgi:hypothetical protein